METYIFILGNHPKLSLAEIRAKVSGSAISYYDETSVFIEAEKLDYDRVLRSLGGTIKIGKVLHAPIGAQGLADILNERGGKIIFGISFYDRRARKEYERLGMEIKKVLKAQGRSTRLVVSREPILSSVVVAKNKCREFMLLPRDGKTVVAETLVVQEFEDYSFRDYGRPNRDAASGMLPPKLAKMMINLSGAKPDDILLDPFCGSGTILQEAIVLGFKNVIGCDISEKAVLDSQKNMSWLKDNLQLTVYSLQLFQCDARSLSNEVKNADVIVTEPYLGPALSGRETREKISGIIRELSDLYLFALREFKKILKPSGVVVMAIPSFRFQDIVVRLSIMPEIVKIGYRSENTEALSYSRPDQKLIREIVILRKV